MNINITPEQVDALYLISDKGLHRLFAEMNSLYDAALDCPADSELIFEIKEAIEAFQGYRTIFKQPYKSYNKTDEPYTALRFLAHLKACRDCYDTVIGLSDKLWNMK